MQFEPFLLSRSEPAWTGARAQCTIRAVKQMTFSSRRPLTLSSACLGMVSEGMGKGHMHVDLLTTCLRVRAHKSGEDAKICGSHQPVPTGALCRAAAEFSISPDVERETQPSITDAALGMRRGGSDKTFTSDQGLDDDLKTENTDLLRGLVT